MIRIIKQSSHTRLLSFAIDPLPPFDHDSSQGYPALGFEWRPTEDRPTDVPLASKEEASCLVMFVVG